MTKQILAAISLSGAVILNVSAARAADNPLRPSNGNIDLPIPVANGDVVELSSGQRIVGDWLDPSLAIRGRLGELTVPARQVVGMKSDGQGAMADFLVTRGGDVLVGQVVQTSLHFRTRDGASVDVAVADISRMSRRISIPSTQPTTRGDTLTTLYPTITTDSGDKLAIDAPASIGFWTRFGHLDLRPNQIAAIELRLDGHPGDRVTFVDGSVLFGLLDGSTATFVPRALSLNSVTVPVAALVRMDFASTPPQPGGGLHLSTGDVLSGRIIGALAIQSGQGNVKISGADIRTINPADDSPGDFRVTQTRGTTITGPPADGDIQIQLNCGPKITVPVGLISNFTAP